MPLNLKKRLQLLRRFTIISPQITLLGLIALLLSLAMGFLAITIFQQDRANRVTLDYNFTDANRPFSDLGRTVVLVWAQVAADPHDYQPAKAQNQIDVMASRWAVLFWPNVQNVLPDESKAAVENMQTDWDNIQSLLKSWQAEPDNATVRSELMQTLDEFQLAAQQAEVRYTSLRAVAISQISDTSEGLVLALGVVSLLIMIFVGVAAFSIHRFIRDSRLAESKTRAALAAEAAALENSRFKDQFLAVMSHELRTPLNAMIGFLGIMGMSGKLDEKNAHMVQRTRANAERLLGLINDILDLSKLESGRMELVPTTLHPFELVQQWRDQMEVLAKQKNLTFTVEMDDSMPRQVEADEGAITRIVTNLLSNAFKFTAEGSVSLRMRAKDNLWMIEVQDTGIGVPAHMHGTIFESFRQADNSFKRPYGGTGLGLSIVQHLVKTMDGTIRLESTVGKGSTFFVSLPLHSVEKPVSSSQPVAQLT